MADLLANGELVFPSKNLYDGFYDFNAPTANCYKRAVLAKAPKQTPSRDIRSLDESSVLPHYYARSAFPT